jgi:hypothetical protein
MQNHHPKDYLHLHLMFHQFRLLLVLNHLRKKFQMLLRLLIHLHHQHLKNFLQRFHHHLNRHHRL